MQVIFGFVGISAIGSALPLVILDPHNVLQWGNFLAVGCELLAFVALTRPWLRRRVQAWIGRIGPGTGGQQDAMSAAMGALAHGRDRGVVDEAQRGFRLLPFDVLARQDWAHRIFKLEQDDREEITGRLRDLTRPGTLGEQHTCFVSHAWGGPHDRKWALLERWANQYHQETGEWPLLWLDRACSDRSLGASKGLALHSMFVSGCQKLVALAGDTYLTRLWAIMEVFCFQYYGDAENGRLDQIVVLPVRDSGNTGSGRDTEEEVRAAVDRSSVADQVGKLPGFEKFDVSKATAANQARPPPHRTVHCYQLLTHTCRRTTPSGCSPASRAASARTRLSTPSCGTSSRRVKKTT